MEEYLFGNRILPLAKQLILSLDLLQRVKILKIAELFIDIDVDGCIIMITIGNDVCLSKR